MASETQVQHATPASAGITFTDDTPKKLKATLNAYFERFAEPPEETGGFAFGFPCLECGEPQSGMLGNFTWGLVHGEGFCRSCHWPARAHHFIKDEDGKEVLTVRNLVLQYHPDFVTKAEAPE